MQPRSSQQNNFQRVVPIPDAKQAESFQSLCPSKTQNATARASRYRGLTVAIQAGGTEFHVHKVMLEESQILSHSVNCTEETLIMPTCSEKRKLPAESAAVFELYHNWLYTNDIYEGPEGAEAELIKERVSQIDWTLLFDAYIFAHKIEDKNFQNSVMDTILQKFQSVTNDQASIASAARNIERLRKCTGCSKGYRFLKALYVFVGEPDWILNKNLPQTILQDITLSMFLSRKAGTPLNQGFPQKYLRPCVFHEHAIEGPVKKKDPEPVVVDDD